MSDQHIVPLGSLKGLKKNPRKHTARNLAYIEETLKRVGAARSGVIDEDGTILAGNGFHEAAQQAGFTEAVIIDVDGTRPVFVRRSGLTEQQKIELAFADNRATDLSAMDALIVQEQAKGDSTIRGSFTDDEWAALLAEDSGPKPGKTDPDDVPAERASDIQRGDLFELGAHRLACDDLTDVDDCLRAMDGSLAQLTVTSPPYGVGVDYGQYEDTLDNLRELLAVLPTRLATVTHLGGYACINFGDIISARDSLETDEVCEYPMAVEYWPVFRSAGWFLHSRRIWAKPHARVAAPWCASSNRAASDWEHVWTWKRPGLGLNERRGPHSYLGVWDTSTEHGVDIGKAIHGAGMAVAVADHCIAIYSNTADVVFEPFAGTGTTLIAAEQLGRRCFALEIEPRYCQVIIDRWEAFTGQKAVKVGEAVRS